MFLCKIDASWGGANPIAGCAMNPTPNFGTLAAPFVTALEGMLCALAAHPALLDSSPSLRAALASAARLLESPRRAAPSRDPAAAPSLRATWAPASDAAGEVRSLAVLSGGCSVAVGLLSSTILICDADTGGVAATLAGHAGGVNALVSLPEGRLASASNDHTVRLWKLETRTLEATLEGHTDSVTSLAVLRDGLLASGGFDDTVRLWDVSTHLCSGVLFPGSSVNALAALPSGLLACGCADGRVTVWSATGERFAALGGGDGFGWVLSLAALTDGRLAAGYTNAPFAGVDGPSLLRVWDADRGVCDAEVSGHTSWVRALLALPDGCLLSGSEDHTLKVWPALVDDASAAPPCPTTLLGHTDSVHALVRLPNGSIVSGSGDGTVRVWA